MKERDYKGKWFLPTNINEKISGTLHVEKMKEFHLDLVGNFFGKLDVNKKIEVILGYTSDGKKFTLIDNFIKNFRTSSPGFSTCIFSPTIIIIGKHFSSYSEINFRHVDLQLQSFDNWLGIYGFDSIKIDEEHNGKIQINYELPKKISFKIGENASGEFNFFVNTSLNHRSNEMKISQKASLRILSDFDRNIDDFFDMIFKFQSFFGLAYFNTPAIEMIEAFELSDDVDADNCVEVLVRDMQISNSRDKIDFLFTYSDIKEKLDNVISNWFLKFEKIRPVLGGLLQSFNRDNKVVEFNFLGIIQSLETFHRRIKKNKILDKEVFKAKIDEILDTISDVHRNWVKERLVYANEPTLVNRLKELFSELPDSLKEKLFENEDIFTNRLKDTRNYYTHYSEYLASKAFEGKELFYATEKLKVILVAILLKELFILDEEFEKKFLKRGDRIFYHSFHNFRSITS